MGSKGSTSLLWLLSNFPTHVNYQIHEDPQEQRLKERSKSNFQTKNKTRLCDSKIRTQEHEICKTNVKTYFYYVNICKYEHEKNKTRLWCKIMLKIGVEQTKGNEGSYFYLYPFGTQFKEASKEVSMCASNKKSFLRTFLIENQLWVN
jgi:hypothetical protein